MSNRLQNKVAVITGGANGIGREAALLFLAEGAKVLIADLNEDNADTTLQIAGQQGLAEQIIFQRTDVSDESQVETMIARAVDHFGGLDVVFNNAGIGGAVGNITETTVEEWDQTFHVLTRGVFLGIKHAARVMKQQHRGGSIINTASIAGISGGAGPHAYSAAKAAVINLTRSVALEMAQYRVRVNAIAPGLIVTDLARNLPVAQQPEQAQPLPVAGHGRHIGAAALFLASDDSEFVTGETIIVDGGLTARGPHIVESLSDMPMAGITYGSTGQAMDIRRIKERSDS